jgi:uncharacterized membrane protein
MIERSSINPAEGGVEFLLRPNRSITGAGLAAFFALLATTSATVAAFSASQGNVFAPPFAVLELVLVGLVLRYVWRLQAREEEHIALTREALTVARQPRGDEVRFHPYWVRLSSAPSDARGEARGLVLSSHGRSVEVGAFLGEDERERLRRELAAALTALRGDAVPRNS